MISLAPALAKAVSAHGTGAAAAFFTGGGVLAASAAIAAFSGVVTDPLQRRLGLHQRRLVKLMDTLEAGFLGGDARMAVREQYTARLLDMLDALAALMAHLRAAS